ncbi:phosphopentomutase [Candidatus Obscuribacterales bacterium]|nr:phosphopentomutase [Candidatus Obscuribacterales bacterium]MBX3152756.1 phosphopentomutase [Candidatus Obscuribacterales bacterium]
MSENKANRRAIVMVIDGCGIGAAPDHEAFGDLSNCHTLANVARETGGLTLPNLARLGLGQISPIEGVDKSATKLGLFGKLEEVSNGKDTQTGHWEMMGVVSETAFPMYPNGFPKEVIEEYCELTGVSGVLCNKPASGTTVLEELGEEHQRTGLPIVYTSGDSVFQIATHVDTVPLPKLYEWCETARKLLDGPHRVGRVIARPFTGTPGAYKRLSGDRRDYAVPPPRKTFLDILKDEKRGVFGVGKIEDIFVGHGLSHAKHTGSNKEGLQITLDTIANQYALKDCRIGGTQDDKLSMIFTNLVDTDSLYGHRRDPKGYAKALVEIDEWLGKILAAMQPEDLLLISSDHGNDPTARGTDHTREFVPILAYSPSFEKQAVDVGIRNGFADVAASLGDWLGADWKGPGVSFVSKQQVAS